MSILKKADFAIVLLSGGIALCVTASTRSIITGGVWGNSRENYLSAFGWKAAVLFLFLFVLCNVALPVVCRFLEIVLHHVSASDAQAEGWRRWDRVWTTVNIIVWIPYYLSYYPGGIYADTFASVIYYYEGRLSNRHPFLYNCLIGGFIRFSELLHRDLSWAMGAFFLCQMTAGVLVLWMLRQWMIRHGIRSCVIHVTMFLAVFVPLVPLSVVSVWKDTPFAMGFLILMLYYTDLLFEAEEGKLRKKTVVGFTFGTFLVAFFRNNGIYVVLVTVLCLLLFLWKKRFDGKKIFYIVSLASVALIVLVQGPLYEMAGVKKTDAIERYGIPLQQVGSVVALGGDLPEEDREMLNHFLPVDGIAEAYCPCIADSLKFNAGLDSMYFSEHEKDFLWLWARLLVRNPGLYIKAYLLETIGFWNPDIEEPDAYVQNYMWNNRYDLRQHDIFQEITGFSFQHFVNPRRYISPAWFFWLFAGSLCFTIRYYGWRRLVYYIPPLSLWLTLMIATPIAWGMRYVEGLLFAAPLAVIIPLLLEREKGSL